MRMNDVDVQMPPRMILSFNTMSFKEDFKGQQTEEKRFFDDGDDDDEDVQFYFYDDDDDHDDDHDDDDDDGGDDDDGHGDDIRPWSALSFTIHCMHLFLHQQQAFLCLMQYFV